MIRGLERQPFPQGWTHPGLRLHRLWFGRRSWQWRARAALAVLAVCVIGVLLGLPKWTLGLAVLGAFVPVGVKPQTSLSEIESRYGAAYTTALVAPEDPHGFHERLQRQAENVVFKAELPPLPYLELLVAGALVALPFMLSLSSNNAVNAAQAVNPNDFRPSDQTSTPRGSAPVVLDGAQAPDVPRGNSSSAPGRSASSNTMTERQVGQVAPGGGQAAGNPEQLDKEFLDALERGAIRTTTGSNASKTGKVEDRDRSASGGKPSDQRNGAQSGQADSSQNAQGQNGKNGQNAQGKNGQQSGQQQNQNGQNQNGQNSKNQNGNQSQQGQQSGQNGSGGPQSQDPSKQFNRGADRGQDGLDQGDQRNPDGTPRSGRPDQPGSGGRNGGRGQAAGATAAGQGKLEYLPGQDRGDQRRSGALQLPGDPSRGLTATPGSPEYRRAVESAILDPRLPPEYREMLKNYYR
jgi:hypothetical protein